MRKLKQNYTLPGLIICCLGLLALWALYVLWMSGSRYSLPAYIAAAASALLFAALCLRFVPGWMRFWSREWRAAPEAAAYSLEENGLSARSVTGGQSAVAGEKIIYTADIALETKDYDAARAALEQALADAGGWMESSNESSYDNARSLSMTLRVPAENYDSFLAAAGQTASLVRRSEHADDVTAQYTDTAGRIANLEGQRDRLRELQAGAETLSDLLDIEAQLSEVQYQLESWQGQLDWYDDQIASCTVTVRLQEVETYTPTGETFLERLGAAFAEGWQNFVRGLASIAVVLAGLWPVVILVCAAVAVAIVVRRRRRR